MNNSNNNNNYYHKDIVIIRKKKQKKKNENLPYIVVPADHKVKIKYSEKYLDLARELRNLGNMKVTVIPVLIGALRTVSKGLVRGLEEVEITGWIEAI